MTDFDLVVVGGGLGGATLGRLVAERGHRVLVLERERVFRDRVRGEVLQPWGVADARRLGVMALLEDAGAAHPLPYLHMEIGGTVVAHRNLAETTLPREPWIAFHHPRMQDVLLDATVGAGATVLRGVRMEAVAPGDPPAVAYVHEGRAHRVSARLVVGADGRASGTRRSAGFASARDPERTWFAGVLLDGVDIAEDVGFAAMHPMAGRLSLVFPQGGGRVRAYVGYHRDADPPRGTAATDVGRFLADSTACGVPAAAYRRARPAGPLAIFDAHDDWVDHPCRGGVALVGDAAATSDPTWGEGMSLTLRDVRTLSEALAAGDDWDAAGHAYARAHDACYGVVHTVDGWYADLFMALDPAADARRARAFAGIGEDPTRLADVPFSGPEVPVDEGVRRRFFNEH